MSKLAIKLNQKVWKVVGVRKELDLIKSLPHISVLMLVINRDDLSEINKLINKVSLKYNTFKLTVDFLKIVKIPATTEFSLKKCFCKYFISVVFYTCLAP